MKKIKYRQYHYDGYSEEELSIPDECNLYEVEIMSMSHRVKRNTWTKAYVLLCPTKIREEDTLVGNMYLDYLSDVFITSSELPILDIESAPKFNGVYSPKYCPKFSDSQINHYLQENINTDVPLTTISLYDTVLYSIGMVRRLTKSGLEISDVHFKDLDGERDIFYMNITEIRYNRMCFTAFSTDPSLARLFLEQTTKIYNHIVNND